MITKPVAIILLFSLGFQTMVLELTVPRLIAPVFGNTLYSWTAIITVVLVALSLGYRWGGKLSITRNNLRSIVALTTIAVLWIAGVAMYGTKSVHIFSDIGIIYGPLISSLVLAAVPALLDAAVVPLTISMLSEDHAGDTSGKCFFWSTLGSICGVVVTGYFLLPFLGSKGALIFGAFWVVLALSLITMKHGMLLLPLLIICLLIEEGRARNIVFEKTNGYHTITVRESSDVRTIFLDSTIEGGIKKGSSVPILGYQRGIEQIASSLEKPPGSAYFIGGGSFSMPRYLKSLYPDSLISTSEIDKDVISVAKDYLELSTKKGMTVDIGDGRVNLQRFENKTIDLVVNDAFHGVRHIPFHLLTEEFNLIVKSKLSDKGVYAINIIGSNSTGKLVSAVINTLKQTFENVRTARPISSSVSNIWVLASKSRNYQYGFEISSDDSANDVVFTDDHAPVEYYVAIEL